MYYLKALVTNIKVARNKGRFIKYDLVIKTTIYVLLDHATT